MTVAGIQTYSMAMGIHQNFTLRNFPSLERGIRCEAGIFPVSVACVFMETRIWGLIGPLPVLAQER